jgi:hypothetical protein
VGAGAFLRLSEFAIASVKPKKEREKAKKKSAKKKSAKKAKALSAKEKKARIRAFPFHSGGRGS